MIPNDISAEKIVEILIDALTPRCKKCGAKLSPYPFYTEGYEVRWCKKCGAENYRKR